MDELAAAANIDPVEFRRRHLTDKRSLAVLAAATERAGWVPRTAPRSVSEISSGRGVAMFIESYNRTRVASVFDVDVNRKSGNIKVKRATVAIDVGLAVNPDSVKSQVEGSVIQGISRLTEEITFDRSRVTSLDWATYPIITFEDVPEVIDVIVIQRPELPASGAGEGATKNVWAGIANAIFDATGVRLRKLPFKPDLIRQSLAQA
jgi:nicotinate dehydrogenase subunit B